VTLKPGDVARIPANTPHQLLVPKSFLYYVIKVQPNR
jgi:mannose-6-phosphate isomerase-like protein (cupin superfamily)